MVTCGEDSAFFTYSWTRWGSVSHHLFNLVIEGNTAVLWCFQPKLIKAFTQHAASSYCLYAPYLTLSTLFIPFSSSSKGFNYCCRNWGIRRWSISSSDPVYGNSKMSSSISETGTDLRGEDGGGRKSVGWRCCRWRNKVKRCMMIFLLLCMLILLPWYVDTILNHANTKIHIQQLLFIFSVSVFAISTGTYMVFPLSIGNCSLAIQCQFWMTPDIPDFSSGKYATMYMVCWCVLSEFNMKLKKFKMSIHPFSVSSIFVCLGVKPTLLNQIKGLFFSLHETFQ